MSEQKESSIVSGSHKNSLPIDQKSKPETEEQLKFQKIVDLNDRTKDVLTDDTFDSLMLKEDTKEKLKRFGYLKPSPVQIEAIPLGLMGNDLLVQAKSGTGKTLVFSILTAELLASTEFLRRTPRVLIVAPTHEIAIQIAGTVKQVIPDRTYVGVFIGGTSLEMDRELIMKGCQIAIGTTGRLCQLVKQKMLHLSQVNLFILDEADKLMERDFQHEINYLFSSCQKDKNVCVFSATYPHQMDKLLCKYMNTPILIRLNADDVQLLGIKQYAKVAIGKNHTDELIQILNSVTYSQCLVFVNEIETVPIIVEKLQEAKHNAKGISSAMLQDERSKVMKDLKNFKIRVLVSSDLTARGIDASEVNLVVSLECATQDETYLHRIGRAGRYGGHGAAITILTAKSELKRFKGLSNRQKLKVKQLKSKYPQDLTINQDFFEKAEPFAKIDPRKLADDEDSEESVYEQVYLNGTVSSSTLPLMDVPTTSESSKPAPFKFVPSRKANKKQYYLKKEFLAIRDSIPTTAMEMLFRRILCLPLNDPLLQEILKSAKNQPKNQKTSSIVVDEPTISEPLKPEPSKFVQSIKDNKNQYLKDEFLVIYDSIPASELDMIFRRIVCMPPDDPLLQGILKSEKNQPKENNERNVKKDAIKIAPSEKVPEKEDDELSIKSQEDELIGKVSDDELPGRMPAMELPDQPEKLQFDQVSVCSQEDDLMEKVSEDELPRRMPAMEFPDQPEQLQLDQVSISQNGNIEWLKARVIELEQKLKENRENEECLTQLKEQKENQKRLEEVQETERKRKERQEKFQTRMEEKKRKDEEQKRRDEERKREENLVYLRGNAILPRGVVGDKLEKSPCPFGSHMDHQKFAAMLDQERKKFEENQANTSAAEEKLGPLVYPRSSNKEYEVEIHHAKKLLADNNYKQHMKLAENLKKRGCLKEAKFMELRAMSYLLDSEEPVVSLIMEKEVKVAGQ